jgi:WD40 repeat protein
VCLFVCCCAGWTFIVSDKPPAIRSLDYMEGPSSASNSSSQGSILAGTADCCVWELSASGSTQDVLVMGHSSDVWAVAFHPTQPNIAASVCDGNRVFVWDLAAKHLLRSASAGFVCRWVQGADLSMCMARLCMMCMMCTFTCVCVCVMSSCM